MTMILSKLKLSAAKMQGAFENIKQQIAAQGAQMEDMKIKQLYILPHLDSAFQSSQQEILEERDFEEEELEDAVSYYSNKGHAKLNDITFQIKTLYKEFGGDIDEPIDQTNNDSNGNSNLSNSCESRELSLEEVVNLLTLLGDRMNELTSPYCEEYTTSKGIPNTPQKMEEFQMGMMSITEQCEENLLIENNVNRKDFQNSIMLHQNSMEIATAIYKMQVSIIYNYINYFILLIIF
jgi:hypothetical protein